jgi:chaperonin GroEL (HSP60 family)
MVFGSRCFGSVHAFNTSTAAREEYVDLVEAGIVDPAKAVRTALKKSALLALSRLTRFHDLLACG